MSFLSEGVCEELKKSHHGSQIAVFICLFIYLLIYFQHLNDTQNVHKVIGFPTMANVAKNTAEIKRLK